MKKKFSIMFLSIMLMLSLVPNTRVMAATSLPVLKSGSSGNEVYALQYLLKNKGYSLSIDGVFGSGTQTAVKNFQSKNGLTSDGIVGTNTWSKLFVTVKQGNNNSAVTAVQHLLKNKFKYSLSVDGIFGSGTASSVKSFQSSKGLSADGIVGVNTWKALLGTSSSGGSTSNFWASRSKWLHPTKGQGYIPSGGEFAANRDNGTRFHAGIDFVNSHGTSVYSMTSGQVINIEYNFYAGTDTVVVRNSDGTVARYCEIKPTISVGTKVSRGTKIGYVEKSTTGSSMLHLEVFNGDYDKSVSLTQRNNKSYKYVGGTKYQRRADLINPTGAKSLPKS